MLRLTWLFAVAALCVAGSVAAQEYPTRPIRVLIPQAPGGAQDTAARVMIQTLSDRVSWRMVIDNRAGGELRAANILTRDEDGNYLIAAA